MTAPAVTLERLVPVETLTDPRLEPYRALRDRDLAGRPGRFVAEGAVVVRSLLSDSSLFAAESVLVAESRVDALRPLLGAVPRDVPVYVASRAILDGLVGFPMHRGLLAIGLRDGRSPPRALLPPAGTAGLVLGLLGIANHDNVGGAFRNAAAFGADAVVLDAASCDPLYRKALRVSVGACLAVPFRRGGTADEMVRDLQAAGFAPFALSPSGERPLRSVAWPPRTALLIGSEGAGLPASLLRDLPTVRIEMAPGFDSLNVATSAGIALHAVRRPAVAAAGD